MRFEKEGLSGCFKRGKAWFCLRLDKVAQRYMVQGCDTRILHRASWPGQKFLQRKLNLQKFRSHKR
jgi:hypothetical protein